MDNDKRRLNVEYNLYLLIKGTTYNWVAQNFGQSEADDPSWDIEQLAGTVAGAIVDKVLPRGDKK